MSSAPAVAKTVWTDEHGSFKWMLEGDRFTIGPTARGFTQNLRRAPVHSSCHMLSVDERGGFSFNRQGLYPVTRDSEG